MKKSSSPEKRVTKPASAVKGTLLPTDLRPSDTTQNVFDLKRQQMRSVEQGASLNLSHHQTNDLLEQYKQLYDFTPVGYFTLSARGVILMVNLAGATMVGTDAAMLIGHSFVRILAPRQRNAFKTFLSNVFADPSKQSADFELLATKQTKLIVNLEAWRSSNGLQCTAIIQDITERKLAQEQMRISETHYRRLFEATHDGIVIIDPITSQIIDANPFITQLLGNSKEQLVGKELFEIGLLKDEAASRTMFRLLKRNHQVRYENLPLKRKDGLPLEVEVVANLFLTDGRSMIQCNIRDITARKMAEVMSIRNEKLNREINRRKVVEENLLTKRNEQIRILHQSRLQEQKLRDFSHQILKAQEEERKRISRELHDVIAQTLIGININLAVLSHESAAASAILKRQIDKTQLLVRDAVEIVHDFARELRPTMLDDLGLISALQAHLRNFTEKTGIRVTLNSCEEIDHLSSNVQTVLYRVALEALTNINRHSKASLAVVNLGITDKSILMEIKDNGYGFEVIRKIGSKKKNRLGLIGMRERVEMIGGTFQVNSAPGEPTTIQVEIPMT